LLEKRETHGAFHTIFQEIRMHPQKCRAYIRMNNAHFMYLVSIFSEELQRQDTQMRKCISPEEMVCLTLRYLATGEQVSIPNFRGQKFQRQLSPLQMPL